MKKYVVTWEEEVIVVCKTRADAEEYIFSDVEEIAYEAFLEDAYYEKERWEPAFFFNRMRQDFEYENEWRMAHSHRPRSLESLYAYILNCNAWGWYISEVEELE